MFRYKLRTLLMVLALGPPVIAAGWWGWLAYREANRRIPDIEELQGLLERDLGAYPVGEFVIPVAEQDALFDPGGPLTMREAWREP